MNIFRCQSCDQVVFLENTQCLACGATLGFLPDRFLMSALGTRRGWPLAAGGSWFTAALVADVPELFP
jgi:hypothetical protein